MILVSDCRPLASGTGVLFSVTQFFCLNLAPIQNVLRCAIVRFLFFFVLSLSISLPGIRAGRAEGDDRDAEDSEHRRTDGHPGGAQWPGPPSQRYGGDQQGYWAVVKSSDVLKEAINT